jgi:hypothetical protein
MISLKQEEFPCCEIGGYIYGSFNLHLKRIYINSFTYGFDHKKLRKSTVELISPSEDFDGSQLIKHSNGFLSLLGSWHTHTSNSSEPSSTDKSQFSLNINYFQGSPINLMVIFDKMINPKNIHASLHSILEAKEN